jgi:hypothetical protein
MTAGDPLGSGAGTAEDKIKAVLEYLSAEFPGDRPNHVPKGAQMAALFDVLDRGAVRRLLIRRRFFDRWTDARTLIKALRDQAVANKMRRTVDSIVELD